MKKLHIPNSQPVTNWLAGHVITPVRTHLVTALIISLSLSGLAFSYGHLPRSQNIEPVVIASAEPTAKSPAVLSHSEPTKLRVPSIGINASFISLGLKADGSMQTPANGEAVGWYIHAPTPGEVGPAIVAGHVDTKAGPAVFWNLGTLSPGDLIEVDRADLTTATFKVDKVEVYPQDKFPTAEVYGDTDYAGIRLITCGGVFSQETKHYSHNTIVFGSLISE